MLFVSNKQEDADDALYHCTTADSPVGYGLGVVGDNRRVYSSTAGHTAIIVLLRVVTGRVERFD